MARKQQPTSPTVTPVDLDAIQDRYDPARQPQRSFDDWCTDQDQQFDQTMRDWQ